ncbi:type II secretion system protein GspG [Pseudomonas sp. Xaverov 259]|nr:type II secretion system protein GspG [Pseudomonas sp. Xaverov 259]
MPASLLNGKIPTQPDAPFDLFSFGKDRTLGGVGASKDITYGDH